MEKHHLEPGSTLISPRVQTGACAVVNVIRPSPEDSVGVFGLGGVGLSAIMVSSTLFIVCFMYSDSCRLPKPWACERLSL